MTYDAQGRRLLSNPLWKDYEFAEPAKGHPSTWREEVKQLRARVAELEAENKRLKLQLADTGITLAEQIGAITAYEADDARASLQKWEGGE